MQRDFEHCALDHEIVLSRYILDEFQGVLSGKCGFSKADVQAATCLLHSRATIVMPKPLSKSVCRDPDDDNIIALALAAGCHCIVAGDKDLLTLRKIEMAAILSPDSFRHFESTNDNV